MNRCVASATARMNSSISARRAAGMTAGAEGFGAFLPLPPLLAPSSHAVAATLAAVAEASLAVAIGLRSSAAGWSADGPTAPGAEGCGAPTRIWAMRTAFVTSAGDGQTRNFALAASSLPPPPPHSSASIRRVSADMDTENLGKHWQHRTTKSSFCGMLKSGARMRRCGAGTTGWRDRPTALTGEARHM